MKTINLESIAIWMYYVYKRGMLVRWSCIMSLQYEILIKISPNFFLDIFYTMLGFALT